MKKHPIWQAINETETGLDKLPIGSTIVVGNYASTGSKSLLLTSKSGVITTTTIAQAVASGALTEAGGSALAVATSTVLGGVKSGTDVTIDASGFISVANDSHLHSYTVMIAGTTCAQLMSNTPAGAESFRECNAFADAPNAGWWMIKSVRHSNATNVWGTQFAYGWEDNQNRPIYHRNVSAGTWGAWQAIPIASVSGSTLNLTF